MKICNFRPLVCIALIVIMAICSATLSMWLVLAVAMVLFAGLWFAKVPTQFKVVALLVFMVALISYGLTTYSVANPYQRTYDPDVGLRGVVLRYVRWYLTMFLSPKNADILYTMMFGDKSVLSWWTIQEFNATGLAHILAVSGFHVDLFYLIVSCLLKLCRVPKRAHIWMITPLLLFYGYLCGWRYAVLRAVIMCLIYAFARHRLVVADALSALSLAAVIILIIYPYALFSASFLLSFACVLGINLWYDTFYRIVPVKSVAMYLAVTAGSLPFLLYFFGREPIFGLVANVILLPLLVVSFYIGIFAVSTFVCGAVLWIVEPLLNFVRWITQAVGRLSWAVVHISHGLPAIFVYFCASIILSRFIFLKPKVKYPLVAVLFTCYFVLLMV